MVLIKLRNKLPITLSQNDLRFNRRLGKKSRRSKKLEGKEKVKKAETSFA